MTTVAIDHNLTLAADSQATEGNVRLQSPVQKLFVVGNETSGYFHVGIAGRYAEALCFINYLEDSLERARLQEGTFIAIPEAISEDLENFNAIIVSPDHEIFVYEGSRFFVPASAPYAIGSGADFALSAMACGKSAKEAVEVAIKFDVFSGGNIEELNAPVLPERVTVEELEEMSREELLALITNGQLDDSATGYEPDTKT